jgi:type II secretory pathway component PulF
VQAGSTREAIDALRRQTLIPVSLEPTGSAAPQGRTRREPRADALATSLRTLATLLAAGTTLDRALGFAGEHAGHQDVAGGFERVRQRVRDGSSLSAALGAEELLGVFGIAVVRAGEESGGLDDALGRLAEHYERVRDLQAQLRSTLLYPALMAIVAGVGIVVLLTFVVPRFSALLADVGGTLPWTTRALVSMSGVVTHWWWLWLPLIALLFVGTRQWLLAPEHRVQWHASRLRWPVLGDLELKLAAARYTRALGVLVKSGVGVLPAMRLAGQVVTNAALGTRLASAVEEVSKGERIGASLVGSLPPLAVQLISAGEESGKLDELSLRAADALDSDVQRRLKSLIALVEPVLIVLFGGVVGFIALALLQAVYAINAGTLS